MSFPLPSGSARGPPVSSAGTARLTAEQTKAILDLRLQRLTALGRDEIKDELDKLAAALREESVLARMRDLGLEPLTGGPDEFQALLEAERAVWVPLIQSLGITLD